eukprot:jgi/Hompol1/3914/HPOL_006819-RA
MAKGLRSKSRRKAKAAMRETVFGPEEEKRLLRLAKKQGSITGSADDMHDDSDEDQKPKRFSHRVAMFQYDMERRGRDKSVAPARGASRGASRSASVRSKTDAQNTDADMEEQANIDQENGDKDDEAEEKPAEMDADEDADEDALSSKPLTKLDKQGLYMNRNQLKKRLRAQSKTRKIKVVKGRRGVGKK